jgi:hypothetical protein
MGSGSIRRQIMNSPGEGSSSSGAPVRNLLPTSRGFDNLHQSELPRSQPTI